MRKTSVLFKAVLLTALLANFSCDKLQEDCNSGGIIVPNYYIFWTATNPGCSSPIEVEVKDASGTPLTSNYTETTHADASAPECSYSTFQTHATFQLFQGERYTYRATCGGRSWSGTINVPCEQNKCKPIQLK
jgi:hypothetical protein